MLIEATFHYTDRARTLLQLRELFTNRGARLINILQQQGFYSPWIKVYSIYINVTDNS